MRTWGNFGAESYASRPRDYMREYFFAAEYVLRVIFRILNMANNIGNFRLSDAYRAERIVMFSLEETLSF